MCFFSLGLGHLCFLYMENWFSVFSPVIANTFTLLSENKLFYHTIPLKLWFSALIVHCNRPGIFKTITPEIDLISLKNRVDNRSFKSSPGDSNVQSLIKTTIFKGTPIKIFRFLLSTVVVLRNEIL